MDPRSTALRGKPATLVTVLGSPKEGWDHSSPWLRRALEDVWGLDLRVVQRPFTLVGVDPALDSFTEVAAEFKQVAETDSVRSCREIGQVVAGASESMQGA
ncbi:hypothetical protein [Demequina lutea]|uniref:FMN-dependent NADH-azoreductase n=1 Tax=Demequina lutea TaxID=431489 RepID=A0A7Y9ZCT9_9MICO|nr:hypothetical protein [Demequina lutea]NYI40976.1 FMN-dependent NADH-azoreductase [Demequina lutea]